MTRKTILLVEDNPDDASTDRPGAKEEPGCERYSRCT